MNNYEPETDADHLQWILERMTYMHKENPRIDYMVAFQRIIDKLRENENDNDSHTTRQR
jgi:hypothetical protein